MMRIPALFALLVSLAPPLAAQAPGPTTTPGGEPVDRVVAVVGDTVLLFSDVQGAIRELEVSGRPLPTDPVQREAVLAELLESRVNDLVLIEAAKAAGITVEDAEITAQVDARIRELVAQFRGDPAFDAALATEGLTRARYRQLLIEQGRGTRVRDEFIGQRMRSRARPLISEEQIRQAFEERSASLGQRPVRLSLQQVIVKPQPSDSALAKAQRAAEQVMTELRDGADFEVLAKRFSEDPGSKEQGGDLGWFKPGQMVKEFENVAFALRPGQTSGIVKTDFGFHIIRLERVRGAERKARHILIRPEVTEADAMLARQRADSVSTAIRAGANPLALARAYETPPTESEVTRIPIDQLPPAYREAAQTATSGAVIGPLALEAPGGHPAYAVVKVLERQEAGAYTIEDVRERLEEALQQQRMMDQLVKELRDQVFVQVMM